MTTIKLQLVELSLSWILLAWLRIFAMLQSTLWKILSAPLCVYKTHLFTIRYLYTILTDSVVRANRLPVLVLCNKQDHALAKGSQVIRMQLEKEMYAALNIFLNNLLR